ncbi:MAG: EF-P lysine aminoacylase EpmA [Lentisphaeria bacterium]|nr:EF-P lysine aminoacylase EpmA [Lentisphaeria bacterium]
MPERSDMDRLRAARKNLTARAVLNDTIRAFFRSRDFLEVDTPVRIPCPANEDYIDAIPSAGQFLRASPELHMKRVLAAGYDRIFQIGPCFRSGERGSRHLPEFTLLEWYRTQAGYQDILDDCRELIAAAAEQVLEPAGEDGAAHVAFFTGDWAVMTVEDAFHTYAAADVDQCVADGCFDDMLVDRVEPNLGFSQPTVLIDYPASLAALARRKPGHPNRAERWELYIRGLEIANAYGELTDPVEQRQRFAESAEYRRRDGRQAYPIDPWFMAALEAGLPPCGGIALGVDRLLMALMGVDSIDQVVAFPPR